MNDGDNAGVRCNFPYMFNFGTMGKNGEGLPGVAMEAIYAAHHMADIVLQSANLSFHIGAKIDRQRHELFRVPDGMPRAPRVRRITKLYRFSLVNATI